MSNEEIATYLRNGLCEWGINAIDHLESNGAETFVANAMHLRSLIEAAAVAVHVNLLDMHLVAGIDSRAVADLANRLAAVCAIDIESVRDVHEDRTLRAGTENGIESAIAVAREFEAEN